MFMLDESLTSVPHLGYDATRKMGCLLRASERASGTGMKFKRSDVNGREGRKNGAAWRAGVL